MASGRWTSGRGGGRDDEPAPAGDDAAEGDAAEDDAAWDDAAPAAGPVTAAPAAPRRGRAPNAWTPGLGPEDLTAYRRRFGLSEQRLADYLGVSVPTIRKWTKEGRAPDPEKQVTIRALLARDYAPPAAEAGAPRPRRGRPPGPRAPAAPARDDAPAAVASVTPPGAAPAPAAPTSAVAAPTDLAAQPAPISPAAALAELAAAYVRSPGGQHLTPDELVTLVGRLRRSLDA